MSNRVARHHSIPLIVYLPIPNTGLNPLEESLEEAANLLSEGNDALAIGESGTLPVGVGFITWSASLEVAIPALRKYRPYAVWLFAPPRSIHDLIPWVQQIREATSHATKIWVQIGSVADATLATELLRPSVLVVQGTDAGGHALARGASIISLVPEVHDKIQEMQVQQQRVDDGRGLAALVQLGAQGRLLGTRFLASPEALIADGYLKEALRAPDDNQNLYLDVLEKVSEEYGPKCRITTYAGTRVGLIKEVMPARDIVLIKYWCLDYPR
ncbi:uncharacterized protein FOBCDRAFT_246320 [Fusarium oxysporum Fo47]|uniref:uncharacterized protein n=1 Tax=Fusarium oxysporum Fo47 TaxID=660027 RepID=UPI002869A7B2|nr:uncharacterized protein FOBCDRAFT_246320 [Fusarium oxysporum Fo47]WJG37394.1 hypothetical protein FOBCDRAFT_246320 [Fusarium oxysporum Fo47]